MRLFVPGKSLLPVAITLAVFAPVVMVSWPRAEPMADPTQPPPGSWPMLGGTGHRNMVNNFDKNIPSDWVVEKKDRDGTVIQKSNNVKWVAQLGSRSYGGPTVAGGRVFVGTNNQAPRLPRIKGDRGIILCFREANGEFLWQATHEKLAGGIGNDWPMEGIASTPVIDGDRLYYVSNRCELVCADVAGMPAGRHAQFLWRLDMMKDLNVYPHSLAACSPLVFGDTVFVVTGNGVDTGHVNIPFPDAPSFIAVDKDTGKVRWQSNAPGMDIMHGQWGNPSFGVVNGKPQVVFPGGDGWLYSFEPETGKLIWKFDANPKDAKYELGGRGTKSDFVAAAPVIFENKVVIGTGQDPEHYEGVGHLWCIDMSRTGDVSAELVVDGKNQPNPNSAVVWHYGGPTTKADRQKIDRDYYFGRTMSTVAVHDSLVYAAELAGYLHCLDFRTGQKYWVHDCRASIWGSPYWVDDKVYLATEEGDVLVFRHGTTCRLLNKIEMGQPSRSTPVAANGTLFIATESHLYAIANK
jgi:outer membrane protein assembly factor BamB